MFRKHLDYILYFYTTRLFPASVVHLNSKFLKSAQMSTDYGSLCPLLDITCK